MVLSDVLWSGLFLPGTKLKLFLVEVFEVFRRRPGSHSLSGAHACMIKGCGDKLSPFLSLLKTVSG